MIQASLGRASDNKKISCYYPHTGRWTRDLSHNLFGFCFWPNNPFVKDAAQVCAAMLAEIKDAGATIISSEILEKVPVRGDKLGLIAFLDAARKFGFDIKVLYVIRRHDIILDSIFKQNVASFQMRFRGSIDAFLRSDSALQRYDPIIDAWGELVGQENVHIAPYLEDHFEQTLDIVAKELELENFVFDSKQIVNPSLEGRFLSLKHYINNFKFDDSQNNSLGHLMRNAIKREKTSQRTTILDQSRYDYVRTLFQDDVDLVTNRMPKLFGAWREYERPQGELFVPFDHAQALKVADDVSYPELRKLALSIMEGQVL